MEKIHDEQDSKILHGNRIRAGWIRTGAWGKRENVPPHSHTFMYFFMVNVFQN